MILTNTSFKGGAPHPTHVFRHTVSQELRRNTLFLVIFCLAAFFLVLMPSATQLIDQNVTVISETLPAAELAEEAASAPGSPLRDGQSYQFGMGLGTAAVLPALAMLLALVQFAYLTNRRAMDVFGALPIRREALLGAKLSAGLLILFVPAAVVDLLIFLLNLILVGYHPYLLWETLLCLLETLVLMLVPYCLTVLVSTLSGTVLENVLYPLTLILAPVVLYALVVSVFSSMLYGYVADTGWDLPVSYLCPYCSVYVALSSLGGFLSSGGISTRLLWDWWGDENAPTFWGMASSRLFPMLLWLGICVGIILLAAVCLRRRRNERAGVKGASRALNTIACLLTVIAGSLFVFALFVSGWVSMGHSVFGYIWLFLAILVIFTAYQLVTLQSVRAMLRSWPLCAVCIGLGAVFVAFLNTNAFGLYSIVPEPEEVESVEVDYTGLAGISGDMAIASYDFSGLTADEQTDPELIANVVAFHQAALDAQHGAQDPDEWNAWSVRFRYRLKDGGAMMREYTLLNEEMAYAIGKLNETDAFLEDKHVIFQEDLTRYDILRISDPYHSRFTDVPLESIDLTALQQAVRQDVLDDTLEEMIAPSSREIGWIHLWDTDLAGGETGVNEELSILVKGNYRNTIAYLESLGLLSGMEPDYSAVQEVAVFSPLPGRDSDGFAGVCLYSNLDYSLRMFTKNWAAGPTLSEDFDWVLEQAAEWGLPEPNHITDPAQIQSLLESCYNQHGYDGDCCSVYVRTLESTTEMILPEG